MKKVIVFLFISAILICGHQKTNAQTFSLDSKVINAGIGLGYTYGYNYSGISSWPALSLSYEQGFRDIDNIGTLSLGGIVAMEHASYKDLDLSWTDIIVAGRSMLHFSGLNVDKLDVYGGLSLGLRFYTDPVYNYTITTVYPYYTESWDKETHTSLYLGLVGGARYYLTDKIAVFGELGWEVSWLKIGASFKL